MNEEELKELLEALGQDTFWINPSEYKKIYYTKCQKNK